MAAAQRPGFGASHGLDQRDPLAIHSTDFGIIEDVEVAPQMHCEFDLRHDLRWLRRWGLTYYGCCEPLDRKLDLLRRIANLRKFSVSYWNDLDRIVSEVGGEYVLGYKPISSSS